MKYFRYKWYSYHLLVACPRCGDKIPLQDTQGNPVCDGCGSSMKMSWVDVLQHVEVNSLKKEAGNKKFLGTLEANVRSETVDGLCCMYCGKTVDVLPDTDPGDIVCNHCSKPLPAVSHERLPDLVFYRNGAGVPVGSNPVDMVAVRCASCGAPLEADPSKANYNCGFCSTINILPLSMRRKTVILDMYVGVKEERHPAHLALKSGDAGFVKRVLRENGRAEYTEEQLDDIILRFPNDPVVLNCVKYELKYNPSASIYSRLWECSGNRAILSDAGAALGKSKEEVLAYIDQKEGKKSEPKKVKAEKKVASGRFTWIIIVLVLAAIAVIVWGIW